MPLFLGGAVLAYVFLPKGFDLLIGFNPAPGEVANIISLDNYMSFVLRMFLVFGIAFVMPVFLVGLNLAGVVSGRQLLKAWRPVILGAFVFAAVATPSGDPWTMSALALPDAASSTTSRPDSRCSPTVAGATSASTVSTTATSTTTRPARCSTTSRPSTSLTTATSRLTGSARTTIPIVADR